MYSNTNSNIIPLTRPKMSLQDQIIQLRETISMMIQQKELLSPKPFWLKTSGGYMKLSISSIVLCEANGNYTDIQLTNGERLFITKTLKHVESLLDSSQMIRCHQSFLVNQQHIKSFTLGNNPKIFLKDISIPISKRKKHLIISTLLQ